MKFIRKCNFISMRYMDEVILTDVVHPFEELKFFFDKFCNFFFINLVIFVCFVLKIGMFCFF